MLVEKERFLVDVSEFMQCCWQTVPSLNTVGSMSVSKNTTVSYGAAYRKSQSAVFMLPTKSVPSAVVGTVLGDVGITQLDWKRVSQARSGGCKSSVAITPECWH